MAVNTIKATIQMRYGLESDLDPDKLVTGEWAVATDTKKIWMCFRPGLVLRMATYEGFEKDMLEVQTILATCQDIQESVERFMQLAQQHASQAETWSIASKSWAIGGTGTRPGEDTNNSKYFSDLANSLVEEAEKLLEQAQKIVAAATTGALVPAGTVAFEDLPSLTVTGYMYNISDDFITDDRFAEGPGIFYRAGANVYWTADGQWDVMIGTQVTGVKGDAEKDYRAGNVNLTARNVGALPLAGGNASGNIGVRSTGTNGAFFTAKNTDFSHQIDFGVASNGTTRGIYDKSKTKWVVKITEEESLFDGAAMSSKPITLSNENIDDLRTKYTTFYYAPGNSNVSNGPFKAGVAFGMYSYRAANSHIVQEAIGGTNKKIRYYNGNKWSGWKTVAFTDSFSSMAGASASVAGKTGLVPAPAAGKQNAYLKGDGTWVTPGTTLAGTVTGIPLDQTMGKQLKDEIDTLNGNLPIENYRGCKILYYRWGGTVTAKKISLLGNATIPEGRTLVALFLSPVCNVKISMSAQGDKVYAWSESYSGAFTYDVLMLLK